MKDDRYQALNHLRVLYVEDNLETREELEMILSAWVDCVYCAANGQEGLALYEKYRPDIVLSDIQMPIMNGLSMAKAIKEINPEQWIVILSAYNDTDYLFRALEIGLQDYVTKPINIELLLDKLLRIADQIALRSEFNRQHKLLEQYKRLVDEKAVVAKVDIQGNISYVNEKFCLLFGYEQSEIIGKSYLSCVMAGQETQISAMIAALSVQGKWQGTIKKCHKSGRVHTVDLTVIGINDTFGDPEEYVALMVDMTDTQDTIDRLSLSLENDTRIKQHYVHEYEQALNIGTALCVLSPNGDILSANENFSNALSCRPEDLTGKSFYQLEQNGTPFERYLLDKVTDHGYATRLITMKDAKGQERTFSTVIVAIHDPSGRVQSLLCLNQDISESVRLSREIIETQKELICIMGEVVENRSYETGMHIKRVAYISQLLALKYGLSEDYAEMIKVAAPMHDIGKVAIPDAILHKPGPYTPDEYVIMKQHAELGFDMLRRLNRPLVQMAARIAHEHHERFDGTGYPLGLYGDAISIEGRIVALVDVFDALSSKRVYKDAWPDDKILDYINDGRGKQFDPELVDLFLKHFDEIKAIRDALKDV